MNSMGQYALFVAWLLALYGVIAGPYVAVSRSYQHLRLLRIATVSVAGFCVLSLGALAYLFLTDNYANQYVWQHSNRGMSWVYKITAIWGGMDGSMLLWAGMLAVMSAAVVGSSKKCNQELQPWLYAVLNSSTIFFLSVVLFCTNPFRHIQAGFIPPEGNGLNPLLQNPYMAIHPPMLYLGFTGFAVPYAFCLAALLSKRLSKEWLQLTCRWTLIAWGFLTAGITLGGHWAYLELGWGGFWAWDPVENSSFLPWLTGTAFLHSVLVQERKGLLKVWNIVLVVATYALTVFGTFLTRSGIVQSVHAFASSDVSWIFLLYLSLIIVVTVVLLFLRWKELRPDGKLDALFSRETAFLVNNLLFVSICFATFWGVMFPVFSEALTGQKQAVGIPYFNIINGPLFLALLFLMALGPLIAWREGSLKQTLKQFSPALVVSIILGLVLIWLGVREIKTLLAYTLVCLNVLVVIREFYRTPARKKHRRRLAGYFIHLGVAIAALSITASTAAKKEVEFSLALGERFKVGEYVLELNEVKDLKQQNYLGLVALVTAYTSDNNVYTTLRPELRRYIRNQETTTEVALKIGLKNDLYLILAGLNNSGTRASFKVYVNPLQVWLWFGVLMMLIGTVVIITDKNLGKHADA